ncbi:type II toxin-antitoxin system ChpB family toxin [Acidithiobacillus thiooxidans]|uniref:Pemk protein n=1 Tax=Acidithiobacillus thiooxidans TaxID=930 RepID=A0A1C2IIL4_ACITH|nr:MULTISPECIES: type II toxin-antitoxin system ChpB family toxin [Acidithiobacillus]MBU2740757.1 type II toxin-antitoxin system ChpB family toxin [Acidithiobacillus albertensis]MBU2836709.1 type II toxin-antitoxin system ChpB family toxin [Acidithiobacillus thiooxidans]MBU2840960.1 type II toxin-antitoxin system ChpB family toxin [Acidithiobacillus thiooxidans]MBU2842501.1 type II toxin-antitoxin system ChpB family toxin [Acidithiobacillus thiooxidans]MDA8177568.1 type II toxin-antitoxin syst
MRWPRRGEIWQANLSPTSGREQQGHRPVLIVSREAFNRSGLVWVCPITQGGNQARFAGFAVSLMGSGTKTQGIVMSNQSRTVDLMARDGKFVEMVPESIVNEVITRIQAILE